MFMDGNSHAHIMETGSMEDWTEQADIDAAQRCPDECMYPGCKRKATEAFTLYFFITWLEDESGNRVRRLHGTPWWYCCQGCGEAMTYEDFENSGERELFEETRDALVVKWG